MAIEITVPALGESRHRGDRRPMVQEARRRGQGDEPLVELETDKVTVEVPAPAPGVLADIKVRAGRDGRASARCWAPSARAPAPAAAKPAQRERPRQAPQAGRQSRTGRPAASCRQAVSRAADGNGGMPPAPQPQDDGREGPRRRRRRRARAGAARSSRRTCAAAAAKAARPPRRRREAPAPPPQRPRRDGPCRCPHADARAVGRRTMPRARSACG